MFAHIVENQKILLLFCLAISVVISIFASSIIIGLAVLILFLIVILFKEKSLIVLSLVAYLGITSDYYENYRSYFNILATLTLFYLFIKGFTFRHFELIKIPKELFRFLLLLLITVAVSTMFSSYLLDSALATFRLLGFLIICYLLYVQLKDEKNIYTYLFSIFIVVALLGSRMLIDLFNLGFQKYFMRGIISNSINLTGSLGYTGFTIFFISFSVLIAMFFLGLTNSLTRKVLLAGFLTVNFLFLILANSRGGLLAAFISGSFVIFILNRKLFIWGALSIILIVLVLYFTLPEISNIANLYLRWDTLGDREKYWQIGISMIKDHPIFGVGPDQFDKYFTSYASSAHLQMFKTTSNIFGKPHPHNFFLFLTAENGVLGFITAVSFFIMFFSLAIKTMKKSKYTNKIFYVLSTAITGVGIGMFFRSFIEITGVLTYGYISRDLPFWILIVILIHIYIKVSSDGKVLKSPIVDNVG